MANLTERQLQVWLKAGTAIAGKSDGDGLTFTLSPAGTASWTLRYRLAGRARELTLGNYPDVSLRAARKLARQKRARVDDAVDVAAEKQRQKAAQRQPGTVAELVEQFLEKEIRPRHKQPKRVESLFERDVLPKIGRLPVEEVTPGHIDRMLRAIVADERPTIANDVLRLVGRVFKFGFKRGMASNNPAAHFDSADAGGIEVARSRRLTRAEIAAVFAAIRKAGPAFTRDNALAVALLLALAVRKMELLAAQWDEFDLAEGVWHLPAGRSKTATAIDIPLADPVIEWLRELQTRACNSPYVFPARRSNTRFPHVSPDTLNVALSALPHELDAFTVHDLRRTARTLLASLGVSSEVAERCLNHKLRGVEGTYNRHDYFEERKQALTVLAPLVVSLEQGVEFNVVPIRGTQAA